MEGDITSNLKEELKALKNILGGYIDGFDFVSFEDSKALSVYLDETLGVISKLENNGLTDDANTLAELYVSAERKMVNFLIRVFDLISSNEEDMDREKLELVKSEIKRIREIVLPRLRKVNMEKEEKDLESAVMQLEIKVAHNEGGLEVKGE